MAILVLGGRGITSSRISSLLSAAKVPFLIASRSSDPNTPYVQAKFDWLDEKTYGNPFETASNNGLGSISGVYIVSPPIMDMVPPMNAFVDFAREKGVKRFVLMSASTLKMGDVAMGKVHEHIASLSDVEWAVLRPTWFMENFCQAPQLAAIKEKDKIYSAAGDGKIPFISADDIARVAFHALTDQKPHNTEHLILGPELLTYDNVADILSSVLGRKITHVNMPRSEFVDMMQSDAGMSKDYAEIMGQFDEDIKNGSEERLNDAVEKVTGKPPQKFIDFAVQMRKRDNAVWK